MTFFKRLVGGLRGGARGGRTAAAGDRQTLFVFLRCHACGEHIRVRIDREHDLSAEFDGASDWPSGYVVHKEVVGQQCFRRIGLDLTFDAQKRLTDQRATGGALVSREDYEVALSGTSRAG